MMSDLFGDVEGDAPLVEIEPLPDSADAQMAVAQAAFEAGYAAAAKEIEDLLTFGDKYVDQARKHGLQKEVGDDKRNATAGAMYETAKKMDEALERLRSGANTAAWEKYSSKL